MVLTEEFKQAIVAAVNEDAAFGFELFEAMLRSAGDKIVTKTYLDEALARQSLEFNRNLEEQSRAFREDLREQARLFDEKLETQAQHFDAKLDQQTQHFDAKLDQQAGVFDAKLEQQAQHFDGKIDCLDAKIDQLEAKIDQKFDAHTAEIKRYLDLKLGYIGSRWGDQTESAFRNFTQTVIAQWGGSAKKWKRKSRRTDEDGSVAEDQYEIDMVVANGKLVLAEMKSSCDANDVERYLKNVERYEHYEKSEKPTEKVILAFYITEPAQALAKEHGIRVILPS